MYTENKVTLCIYGRARGFIFPRYIYSVLFDWIEIPVSLL